MHNQCHIWRQPTALCQPHTGIRGQQDMRNGQFCMYTWESNLQDRKNWSHGVLTKNQTSPSAAAGTPASSSRRSEDAHQIVPALQSLCSALQLLQHLPHSNLQVSCSHHQLLPYDRPAQWTGWVICSLRNNLQGTLNQRVPCNLLISNLALHIILLDDIVW